MQYFAESARALIARALELGQQCGAEQLLPEHILVSASSQGMDQTGLRNLQIQVEKSLARSSSRAQVPEFGPQTLSLFERAYRSAEEGQVEEIHLLFSLDLKAFKSDDFCVQVLDLLNAEVIKTFESRGVNVKRLIREVGELDLLSVLPEPDFFHTPPGLRILDLLSGSPRPGPGAFSILLMILLRPGPLSRALSGCGLSEPMLIEILVAFSQSTVDELLASCQLEAPECLGAAAQRLTRAARLAFAVAWNCAQRQSLGPQNLLDGLLCADMLCQPGQGATAVLRKLEVLGFAHAATRKLATTYDYERRVPELSAEVRQVMRAALEVAGADLISTEHLLYGLSTIGLEELTSNGLTPARILRHLGAR